MKREAWIDSCRFFAIFVIMFTHFLAMHLPSALALWEGGVTWWLFGGLTGKFAVAFFFVLLGYFASAPRAFSPASFGTYCITRYFRFSFFVFASTLVYILCAYASAWLFHSPDGYVFCILSDGPQYNLIWLLHDAFLFEDHYNATLWCMQQLFLASLVCRIAGYLPESMAAIYRLAAAFVLMIVLLLCNAAYCIWICIALLGYLLRFALKACRAHPSLTSPASRSVLFLVSVVCIKAPLAEGVLLYALEGLGAFLLILVLFHTGFAKKALAKPPFPWLGSISMGLFVVHTPVNSLLASTLIPLLRRALPEAAVLIVGFVVSFSLCVLSAWLLGKLYALAAKRIRSAFRPG